MTSSCYMSIALCKGCRCDAASSRPRVGRQFAIECDHSPQLTLSGVDTPNPSKLDNSILEKLLTAVATCADELPAQAVEWGSAWRPAHQHFSKSSVGLTICNPHSRCILSHLVIFVRVHPPVCLSFTLQFEFGSSCASGEHWQAVEPLWLPRN